MTTEIRTGVRCEYVCDTCGIDYIEQRPTTDSQYYVKCQKLLCTGTYELVNETEFTYEQEVPDPVVETPTEVTE